MGEDGQTLIVDLSGDQKSVLGFATWKQVSISAVGLIFGALAFSLVRWLFSLMGAGLGTSVIFAGTVFAIILLPFVYVAFKPIKDAQNNILYYEYKQLIIDRNFKEKEIGTYINIQPNTHVVNKRE